MCVILALNTWEILLPVSKPFKGKRNGFGQTCLCIYCLLLVVTSHEETQNLIDRFSLPGKHLF